MLRKAGQCNRSCLLSVTPINIAQGEHKEVVSACTEGQSSSSVVLDLIYTRAALADDPEYVKALQRRASSNEELNTWTSLSSAQEGTYTLYRCTREIRLILVQITTSFWNCCLHRRLKGQRFEGRCKLSSQD